MEVSTPLGLFWESVFRSPRHQIIFSGELFTVFEGRTTQGDLRALMMMSCGHFVSAGSLDIVPTIDHKKEISHLVFAVRQISAPGIKCRNQPFYYRLYFDGLLLELAETQEG
jgi:hypothetical protein